MLEKRNIKQIFVPPYTPSSNGISERINRTINEILRFYKKKKLKKVVDIINKRINLFYHRSKNNLPIKKLTDKHVENIPLKDYKAAKRHYGIILKKFDLVFIKNFNASKTSSQYNGPYKVIRVGKKNKWVKVRGKKDWVHKKI